MANLGPQSTQSRTAQQFILSACRLVGALRSGQNMSAAELADGLQVFNDLLDSWSASSITIYVVQRITNDQSQIPFTLIPNQQTPYTLGNALGNENFLTPRPPRLERVSYIYSASQQTPIEKPLAMYDSVQWQNIANKSVTSLLPQVCYVEDNFPDMNLSFWPVVTQANPIVLYAWGALAQVPSLQTVISFPPGYSRALRYNLAVDLFSEFSGDMQKLQVVAPLAIRYKQVIEGLNSHSKIAYCDPAIVGGARKRGNIYTGTSNRSS